MIQMNIFTKEKQTHIENIVAKKASECLFGDSARGIDK